MTHCITDSVAFSSHGSRVVLADFRGGAITSDAGALLLREADQRLGLVRRLAACITDPREPSRIVHDQETMLRQRIIAIALGYEDLNDHQSLRVDPALQLMAGADGAMASPPTLCRLENRVDRASMWRLAEVIVDTFIASFNGVAPRELTLDFDATDDRVHGRQEGRFFHAYYDSYCFLPLYIFCGEQLLGAYLRPSNIDASRHAWAILSLLVKKLRSVAGWGNVRIVVRGDSGFCRWRMLRWCERNNVFYIVGIARNSRLLTEAAALIDEARAAFSRAGGHAAQRVFGERTYAAHSWDTARRIIVKAEHLPPLKDGDEKANTRFVVTNLEGEPRHLYEDLYCARGEMENRIKEQQLGLFADRTSCHKFAANQFRVLLSAVAYMLVEHIRRVGLAGTELARAQVTRIRLELFKIGARVVASVRRIVLHLASGCPAAAAFTLAAQRLMAPT